MEGMTQRAKGLGHGTNQEAVSVVQVRAKGGLSEGSVNGDGSRDT